MPSKVFEAMSRGGKYRIEVHSRGDVYDVTCFVSGSQQFRSVGGSREEAAATVQRELNEGINYKVLLDNLSDSRGGRQ